MRSSQSKKTKTPKGTYAKTTQAESKDGKYRSAARGRFIGEQGRRATVARDKPSSVTIRERRAV